MSHETENMMGTQIQDQVVNMAMALMRETRDAVKAVNEKLDKLSDERREEAREHGTLEHRLQTLEAFKDSQEAKGNTTRVLVLGAILEGAIALLVVLWRLAATHPDVIPK